MMLELREYQKRALGSLDSYLERASEAGAEAAFIGATKRPYHTVPALGGHPYVCIRVPTGGGKTLMAVHTVGMVAHQYVQSERVFCLWLVPSNAILDQTLNRLKDRDDPYRRVLDEEFDGRLSIMDISEALHIQRGTLASDTVIVVSTLAALRVEDTTGRKVYEPNGQLHHHFDSLPPHVLSGLESTDGLPVPSLANLIRLHRPIVIVDEAHNARTPLSFETLARFSPGCIIEFTATPSTRHEPSKGEIASNVLAHVSAAELKAEEMVKLPVKLVTRSVWTDAVGDAIALQRQLEEVAAREREITGEYIRPIVLMQAQPRSQHTETITPERLKESLIKDFRIPEAQIAIATGSTREIDGVDLENSDCGIRFIITQQALREGWDCPMAYVLCSVAEIASARSVEQLLGRVLRMPHARAKREESLNCAYAVVVSPEFAKVAGSLRDALIENGFQRLEADDLVVAAEKDPGDLPLFGGSLYQEVSAVSPEAPDLTKLAPTLRERVSFATDSGQITVSGGLSAEERSGLEAAFTTSAGKAIVDHLYRAAQGRRTGEKPADTREPIAMPRLYIRRGEEVELLTEGHFLETTWRIADEEAHLSAEELTPNRVATGEVDVDESGRVKFRAASQEQPLATLTLTETGWTTATLAVWLDRQIPHPDLRQSDVSAFIYRLLEDLSEKGVPIDQMARQKFRLRKLVGERIATLRDRHRQEVFQRVLFGESADELVVDLDGSHVFNPAMYAPNWFYEGPYEFRKHAFPRVGELKSEGEEHECAIFIDEHPLVDVWVRNLDSRPRESYWLPVPSGRFYPDFVGRLTDGRSFLVEYKGGHLWSNDESKLKRAVGETWAARSEESCVFVMPHPKAWTEIDRTFRS